MIMKAVKKPMGSITVLPEVEIGLVISKLQFTVTSQHYPVEPAGVRS